MRQMQKDGSSVWLFPLPVRKVKKVMWWSLLMHCVLWQQILLHYPCEGWGMSLLPKQKAEVFNSVILWSFSHLFNSFILCHSWHPRYLEWLKRDVAAVDWWYPFLAKCKAHSLPCSASCLVSRKLNSVSKGQLHLMDCVCLLSHPKKELLNSAPNDSKISLSFESIWE